MLKPTLFDTSFARAAMLDKHANNAQAYLIKNLKLVELNEQDMKILSNTKSFASTPIGELYLRLIETNNFQSKFIVFDFTGIKTNVPEILTMDEITIDGNLLPNNTSNLNKIWINVTPILGKRNPITNNLTVVDVPKLHSLFARGLLCKSYSNPGFWLNPKLSSFVIKSYTMTITRLLQRSFYLDPDESSFVQTLFAAYYAQLMDAENQDLAVPPLLFRCNFLGSVKEITEKMEVINGVRNDAGSERLSIPAICDILRAAGPSRMKELDVFKIYRLISAGATDTKSMFIALDYPPYWVYQLLKYLSGGKNAMLSTVFKAIGLKNEMIQFSKELLMSQSLFK